MNWPEALTVCTAILVAGKVCVRWLTLAHEVRRDRARGLYTGDYPPKPEHG